MELGIYIFFCSIAAVIVGYDVKKHKIPNGWLVTGIVAAFAIRFLDSGASGCMKAVESMMLPFLLLFPLYVLGMIGAGDVKYLCMFSTLLDWKQVIYMMFYACALGSIWSLARMIKKKSLIRRFQYLRNYAVDLMCGKGYQKYFTAEQGYEDTVAFALPIGLSFLLHLGGVY